MIIKKMTANYGCLNGDSVEFKKGLNIINAPNESGKSTWCSFIRAMLYGINSSERDKAGYLSDKTKYQPWSGGEMCGSMDITAQGSEITLQRSNLGKAPMRNFSAVYEGTETAVDGLNADNAGEAICRMSKTVFERSVFIKESDVQITQTSELEKRITAIVSSGDEQFSYSDADSKLREWTRRRKFNNSGEIPATINKMRENAESLQRIRKDAEESAKLRGEIDVLTADKALLTKETEAHDALEKLEMLVNVKNAHSDMTVKKRYAEAAENALKKYGSVDDGLMDSVRAEYSALGSVYEMADTAENNEKIAREIKDEAEKKKNDSVFASITPEEAAEKAAGAKVLSDNAHKSHKGAVIVTVITVLLALIFAAAAVYTYLYTDMQYYYSIIAAALCIIAIIICICVNVSAGKKKKLYAAALSQFNMKDADGFAKSAAEYKTLCDELTRAEHKLSDEEADVVSANELKNKRVNELIEKARKISADIGSVDDITPCLEKVSEEKKVYKDAASKADIAEGLYNALAANAPKEDVKTPEISPRFRKSQTAALLDDCSRNLEKRQAAFNMTLGRMRAIGDPLVIESENREMEQKLGTLEYQYDALMLAQETLKQADTEIQTRFAPVLGRAAGNIFHELTGGKYDMLAFDRSLDAAAQAHGDTISHNVLSLSSGTVDQVYLALRLAISNLCNKGDDPCPIILDDALICFDDERMGYALEYLKKLSEKRQVILFTCQKREAEYFKDDDTVNKLELNSVK